MKRFVCALAAMAAAIGIMAGGTAKATILYQGTSPDTPASCIYNCKNENFGFGPLSAGTYYFFVVNQPEAAFSADGGVIFGVSYTDYASGVPVDSGTTHEFLGTGKSLSSPDAYELTIPSSAFDQILPNGDERVSSIVSGDLMFSIVPQYFSFTVAVSDNIADVTTTFVPEPGTWLLMILGFFACGTALRRKRRLA